MDFARFSNPHACDAHPMAPGKQVRFMVDEKHHAHGCVEQIVYGGAWVKLDDGEKLFVKKKDLRVENPSGAEATKQSNPWHGFIPGEKVQYEVRLDAPESIERVTLDGREAHLFRFGKYVLSFAPTTQQRRKIVEQERALGPHRANQRFNAIRITSKQIVRRAA